MKTEQQEREAKEAKDERQHPDTNDNKNEVLDFVNDIKREAMNKTYEQAGFIYEPVSGLYW